MNFRIHMASLRGLSDDYYHGRIMLAEYRQQRAELLDQIDEELNGIKKRYDDLQEEKGNDSLINKALSFFEHIKLEKN